MGNFLQQQESLIFWVILSCMENLTGYRLFMAALPLASRIRKVICGDLKNVSWFVATQYAKCQITAKKPPKKQSQSQLCSHREYTISACCFLRLSIVVLNTRVWFSIPADPSCLYFSLYFPPEPRVQVSYHGRGWERNRQRQRWTASAISPWNIYASLVLWLHAFWQWWHINVNRRSWMQPLLPCIKLTGFYSLCCFYSCIHPSPPYQRLPGTSVKALLASVLCVSSLPTQDQI